jgi:integrase
VYGFHGFRKGFATENYDTMPSAVLQKRMRHRSFTTTLGYINLGKQVEAAADRVKVPPVLRKPVEPKPTTAMTEPTPEPPSDTGPEAS